MSEIYTSIYELSDEEFENLDLEHRLFGVQLMTNQTGQIFKINKKYIKETETYE